jgi:hypothetical protein
MLEELEYLGQNPPRKNLDMKEWSEPGPERVEPRGHSVDVKEETTRSEPVSERGDLEELFGDYLDMKMKPVGNNVTREHEN